MANKLNAPDCIHNQERVGCTWYPQANSRWQHDASGQYRYSQCGEEMETEPLLPKMNTKDNGMRTNKTGKCTKKRWKEYRELQKDLPGPV